MSADAVGFNEAAVDGLGGGLEEELDAGDEGQLWCSGRRSGQACLQVQRVLFKTGRQRAQQPWHYSLSGSSLRLLQMWAFAVSTTCIWFLSWSRRSAIQAACSSS